MSSSRNGCFRALAILVFVALIAVAAGYFFRGKLIAAAQERLNRALVDKQIYLDYQLGADARLTALSLRDLTLFQDSGRQQPVASLDQLSLRIALIPSLLHGSPEVAVSTRNAKLTFFASDDPIVWEQMNLSYLHGRESRNLEHLQATTRGLEFDLGARWDVPAKQPTAAGSPPSAASPAPSTPSQAPSTPAPVAPPQPPATGPDLSVLAALAEALDYRQATFQPKIRLRADGKRSADGTVTWTLTGETRSFPSQGTDLQLAGSAVAAGNDSLSIHELTLSQGAARSSLTGTLHRAAGTFELAQFDSTLNWTAILRDFPALKESLAAVQTTAPPHLVAQGKHQLGHPEKSDLSFTLAGWGLDYQRGPERPPLEFRELQLQGTLRQGTVDISSFQGGLANGTIRGKASVEPFKDKLAWRSNFQAHDLALARLVKPTSKFPAEGSVRLAFDGLGSEEPQTLQGRGALQIRNGRFVDVQILGSLLGFLARISPGLNPASADQVAGTFTVRDGVLRTEDLLLEVSASQVNVLGQVDLTTKQTNLEARANLRGLLSAITQSFTDGQGLVIEGTGPVDDIDWKLRKPGKDSSSPTPETPANPAAPSPEPANPEAPTGSLKDQIKQQAMDSLLNGSAEQAVGNLIRGIKERRAIRKQENAGGEVPPPTPAN